MDDFLILQKSVDLSVLRQGFSIPALFQPLFYKRLGFTLAHGEKCPLTIRLDTARYTVELINQGFDTEKYAGHTDVLQIRYGTASLFAQALRERFASSWQIISDLRAAGEKAAVPVEKQEFLALYAAEPGVLMADCITCDEYRAGTEEIRKVDERTFEAGIENTSDPTAAIIEKAGTRKIRRLSRAIGENLKQVYEYRCQICGARIGTQYGCERLIHAHHIDFFTRSLNNNAENILIVCPNHHGIIHDRNPKFDAKRVLYRYPNGYTEGLLLNRHIGKPDPAK